MKERLTNNLVFKIISVLFAVFLWWTVVNIDDPVISKNFKAEVQLQNTELITNSGKCYQIVEDTKIVSVLVRARRSVIEDMNSSDILLTADVYEMQDNMIPIRIRIPKYEGKYEEASTNPRNIVIETEDIQTKTFTVVPTAKGEVGEGYALGELEIKSNRTQVEVSGPKSMIGLISRVEAVVNVSGMTESSVKNAKLVYYNSADNVIEQSQFTSSLDAKKIKVSIEVLHVKEVPLEFDTSQIGVASGYVLAGIEAQTETITVVGPSDVLNNTEKLTISGKALKGDNLSERTVVEVDISEYLPEDIFLKDVSNSKMVVTILIERQGTKTVMFPIRAVKVENVPDGFTCTYGPEQEIELVFSGVQEALDKMDIENVEAMIDLTDCEAKEGKYQVKVQVKSAVNGCKYIGDTVIDIELIKAENTEE